MRRQTPSWHDSPEEREEAKARTDLAGLRVGKQAVRQVPPEAVSASKGLGIFRGRQTYNKGLYSVPGPAPWRDMHGPKSEGI